LEITGGQEKIKAALTLLSEFGIEEQVSTGLTAMTRGVSQKNEPAAKNAPVGQNASVAGGQRRV
jgi:hypothetical protein